MADVTITRGKTLPDSGVKNDLHELVDLATGSISNIVNADVKSSAAIAGTKIAPNFGAQDVVCDKVTAADDITCATNVAISGTTDLGDALTLTGALDVTGAVTIDGACTIFGAWSDKSGGYGNQQAASDGFVCAWSYGSPNANIVGYTDSSATPTTVVAHQSLDDQNDVGRAYIMFPVKKDDYWKITITGTLGAANWIPLG